MRRASAIVSFAKDRPFRSEILGFASNQVRNHKYSYTQLPVVTINNEYKLCPRFDAVL
jgi:hypothetical protein